MNFKVKIQDAGLQRVLDVVKPNGKAKLTEAGAYSLYVAVMRHVQSYARTHHASANRLGAQPSEHIEGAVDDISYGPEGNGAAAVTIPIPGFTRAFGDLHIRPKYKKCLTIPINAAAYGVRAPEMEDDGWNLFTLPAKQGPGAGILFGRKDGMKSAVALYLLRNSADIPQDRSMLPTDEDMVNAVQDGMMAAIRSAMSRYRGSW